MPNTVIHVPMSLNRQFATQTCLLVRSIAANARLPGPWRVVLTVSRDTTLTLDDPLMHWTRDFPVSMHWVDQDLWDRYHWSGTGLQMHLYDEHDTDAILFMDADTLVVGPLTELVESIVAEPVVAGWPAWAPPANIDLDSVVRECGLPADHPQLTYSGFGLAFEAPRHCGPYFNLGFLAVNGDVARAMAKTLPADFAEVLSRYKSWFVDQVAVCVNILRQGYRYRALDMRYNTSNGDWDEVRDHPFTNPESRAIADAALRCVADARVLHYCVTTKSFARPREMDGFDAVRAFCARPGLDSGSRLLQDAMRPLLEP